MGDTLDIIASIVFLCFVVPKTIIISKLLSIHIPRGFLYKASIGSFAISLATLSITAIVTLPLIVGTAYSLSSSQWLQAAPILIGYLVITIFPGLFFERHMLLKGGVSKAIAFRICIMSNLYLLFSILVLSLCFYIIAMIYF